MIPSPESTDGYPGTGQQSTEPVVPVVRFPAEGELPPRIAALLRKQPGQLTDKERRVLQDFRSRQRQRGPGAFDMSPVALRQDLEPNGPKCRSPGDRTTP